MARKKVVILGAGITGLASAYYLSKNFDVTVIEKENFLGGSAASFQYDGFALDLGPHKIYTELPGILDEMQKICPLIRVKKKNSIYLKNNYYDFPLKLSQIATKMPLTALSAGFDILLKPFSRRPDDSYENFLINRFGKTLYNLSFRDYAWKVWNSDPKELDKELAKRRVAVSGIFELIKSVLFKQNKKISAEHFYYPEKGMKQFFDSLAEKMKKNHGKLLMKSAISQIKIKGNKLEYIKVKNKKIKADYVISTIPLDSLAKITGLAAQTDFKYQKLNIIYFILNKERALGDCWIFFPEKKFIFQRVSEQKAFSSLTCPKGKTAIMVETTREISTNMVEQIIRQLEQSRILNKEDIDSYFVKSIEKAYPVYKKGFSTNLSRFTGFLDNIEGFYLLGRQGLFNYNNMDQCWDMALKVSEHIKGSKGREQWQNTKRYFDGYRIVD